MRHAAYSALEGRRNSYANKPLALSSLINKQDFRNMYPRADLQYPINRYRHIVYIDQGQRSLCLCCIHIINTLGNCGVWPFATDLMHVRGTYLNTSCFFSICLSKANKSKASHTCCTVGRAGVIEGCRAAYA